MASFVQFKRQQGITPQLPTLKVILYQRALSVRTKHAFQVFLKKLEEA